MDWDSLTDLVSATCRDTFGVPVGYTSFKTGESFQTVGIFDAEYKDAVMLDGMIVQETYPRLGIRLGDFPILPDRGDTVMVKSTLYQVQEYRPDGQAGATLVLSKDFS